MGKKNTGHVSNIIHLINSFKNNINFPVKTYNRFIDRTADCKEDEKNKMKYPNIDSSRF